MYWTWWSGYHVRINVQLMDTNVHGYSVYNTPHHYWCSFPSPHPSFPSYPCFPLFSSFPLFSIPSFFSSPPPISYPLPSLFSHLPFTQSVSMHVSMDQVGLCTVLHQWAYTVGNIKFFSTLCRICQSLRVFELTFLLACSVMSINRIVIGVFLYLYMYL